MKVLLLASEVDPFAKTGGLADVAGALPKALAALKHDVRVAMPLYKAIDRSTFGLKDAGVKVIVRLGSQAIEGRIWTASLPKSAVTVYFIECDALYGRDGLYQDRGTDFPDNLTRFSFFSQAALRMLPSLRWQPEVVHCHDWQAALGCVHLARGPLGQEPFFAGMAPVLTVHNLAYQGLFPREQWPLTALPDALFAVEGLEFYGQVNCLKGGLFGARAITTVSPTYAKEIQTPEFGCGLDRLLLARRDGLRGILNGIDVEEWNPQADPHIVARYSADEPSGKSVCKQALQQSQRLPERPDLLIGMIQRLAEQKGIDIFVAAAEELMALPVQFAILGTGDAKYHQQLEALAKKFPGRLALNLKFDNALAHQIEAGADAFLMPSRFEPCGLNQMYSMRFGTVPIVKQVGGLADTVVDLNPETNSAKTATGFVFKKHSANALLEAVRRAVAAFGDQALWAQLSQTGMRQDFSWTRSASTYVEVYEKALAGNHDPHRHPQPVAR